MNPAQKQNSRLSNLFDQEEALQRRHDMTRDPAERARIIRELSVVQREILREDERPRTPLELDAVRPPPRQTPITGLDLEQVLRWAAGKIQSRHGAEAAQRHAMADSISARTAPRR